MVVVRWKSETAVATDCAAQRAMCSRERDVQMGDDTSVKRLDRHNTISQATAID